MLYEQPRAGVRATLCGIYAVGPADRVLSFPAEIAMQARTRQDYPAAGGFVEMITARPPTVRATERGKTDALTAG